MNTNYLLLFLISIFVCICFRLSGDNMLPPGQRLHFIAKPLKQVAFGCFSFFWITSVYAWVVWMHSHVIHVLFLPKCSTVSFTSPPLISSFWSSLLSNLYPTLFWLQILFAFICLLGQLCCCWQCEVTTTITKNVLLLLLFQVYYDENVPDWNTLQFHYRRVMGL